MEQYANYKKSKYQVSWFCICFFQRKSILLSNPFLSATAYNSCSTFLGVGFQTCVRQCEYKMLHISHLAIPRCFSCKEESVACHRAQVIISVLSRKTFKLEFCVSEFFFSLHQNLSEDFVIIIIMAKSETCLVNLRYPDGSEGSPSNPAKFKNQDFAQIKADCLQKRELFVDNEFPPNGLSVGDLPDMSPSQESEVKWLRPAVKSF